LSQQQKKIVVRRSNGMPSKEVADALNITVNNVDVVYSQAKKQMGKMIRQDATLMQQIEETLQFHKKEIVDNDN
jgi:transcriptional regulator